MTAVHTPGPWLIAEDGFVTVKQGNNYSEVAKVFDAPFPDGEVRANARLIAAYLIGGPFGIVASMVFYSRLTTLKENYERNCTP
jgi:hypothetical protein